MVCDAHRDRAFNRNSRSCIPDGLQRYGGRSSKIGKARLASRRQVRLATFRKPRNSITEKHRPRINCSQHVHSNFEHFELALQTGIRQGTQYNLVWEMVDWQSRMLHIPTTKNEEPPHIPLNDGALAALKVVRARGVDDRRVFLCEDFTGTILNIHSQAGYA